MPKKSGNTSLLKKSFSLAYTDYLNQFLSHFINGHPIGDKARLLSRFSIDYINMLFTRFYIKPSINQIPVNFKNRLLVKQCIKLFISHISVSFLTKYSRKHISRNKPSRKVNSYCVIRIKSLWSHSPIKGEQPHRHVVCLELRVFSSEQNNR